MPTNFPTSVDNFSNPSSNDSLNAPSHSLQHANANDAIEAIEAKLGVGNSNAGTAVAGAVLRADGLGTTTYSAKLPFAMQAGTGSFASIVSGSTSTTATITFATNRFSQTPMLTANAANPFNSVYWPVVIRSISSSSASIAAGGASSPGSSGMVFWFIAVQMDSGSGAG